MVKSIAITAELAAETGPRRMTIWGFSPQELHRAYWWSKGVQCIERGLGAAAERQAELYLLVEPRQMVLFDLRPTTERMTWDGTVVMRLRVIEQEGEAYRERVIADDFGRVERIERSYRPHATGSYRVIVTTSRHIAAIWSQSHTRREGWSRSRRSVPYYQVDHARTSGSCFDAGSVIDDERFLDALVSQWEDPGRAIEGISQVRRRIWAPDGVELSREAVVVGPAWLGATTQPNSIDCLVGPAWRRDEQVPGAGSGNGRGVRLRPIIDIDPPAETTSAQKQATPSAPSLYPMAKRAFDVVLSTVALLLALPLMLVVAIAIVIDDGFPIFFGHVRQTTGGKLFKCWKFRTMRRDADDIKERLRQLNVCDGPQFFMEDDPRVTRVGRILRRWHIDEIPQAWNVLVGQMSIVGPRPSPDKENQYCPAWRELRLSVRPGITGLWQIERTRQPGKDFQEWIQYDIEYVRGASFALDLQICARTIASILFRRRNRGND